MLPHRPQPEKEEHGHRSRRDQGVPPIQPYSDPDAPYNKKRTHPTAYWHSSSPEYGGPYVTTGYLKDHDSFEPYGESAKTVHPNALGEDGIREEAAKARRRYEKYQEKEERRRYEKYQEKEERRLEEEEARENARRHARHASSGHHDDHHRGTSSGHYEYPSISATAVPQTQHTSGFAPYGFSIPPTAPSPLPKTRRASPPLQTQRASGFAPYGSKVPPTAPSPPPSPLRAYGFSKDDQRYKREKEHR